MSSTQAQMASQVRSAAFRQRNIEKNESARTKIARFFVGEMRGPRSCVAMSERPLLPRPQVPRQKEPISLRGLQAATRWRSLERKTNLACQPKGRQQCDRDVDWSCREVVRRLLSASRCAGRVIQKSINAIGALDHSPLG